jgi:signal transduction histidine kinase
VSETIPTDPLGGVAVADPLAVRANKLELLERLADALAHEIKNPLHSMVINLEVLKRRLGRIPGGDEVLRYTNVLGEELDRVSRRVELLLRLSRPDRASEETTLTELVEEVMELVQLEARHRDARVEYNTEGAMARVRVGRQTARQIILNLVLDALESLPSGETLCVTVRGEDRQSTLVIQGPTVPEAATGERTGVAALLAESVGGRVWAQGGERTFVLPSGRV